MAASSVSHRTFDENVSFVRIIRTDVKHRRVSGVSAEGGQEERRAGWCPNGAISVRKPLVAIGSPGGEWRARFRNDHKANIEKFGNQQIRAAAFCEYSYQRGESIRRARTAHAQRVSRKELSERPRFGSARKHARRPRRLMKFMPFDWLQLGQLNRLACQGIADSSPAPSVRNPRGGSTL